MLTFLRKIRRSLIESNSPRKYLLYAIGEIALVVIGILIALQINNWNENRKDRIKESKVLSQVAKTIQSNSEHFERLLQSMNENNQRTEAVISIIEKKPSFDTSMIALFHSSRKRQYLRLNLAGYETLKNAGFDIIQSDTLKDKIINLFETTYSHTKAIFTEVPMYESNFRNFLINNFLEPKDQKSLVPVDYKQLISNHFYYSSLLYIRNIRNWRIRLIEDALNENNKVLQFIKDELGDEQ